MRWGDGMVGGQDPRTVDGILEFTHVPGPVMVHQHAHGSFGKPGHFFLQFLAEDVEETVGQRGNIAAALPQGLSATSNIPLLLATAPVNEPLTCPNSSLSRIFSLSALQSTGTKGLSLRKLLYWMGG